MLAGVLKQDEGEIEIDGEAVWENEKIKGEIFFLPDNALFSAKCDTTADGRLL